MAEIARAKAAQTVKRNFASRGGASGCVATLFGGAEAGTRRGG